MLFFFGKNNEISYLRFECQAPKAHNFHFLVLRSETGYQKIGQTPSPRDMIEPKFNENISIIERTLGSQSVRPIKNALMTASHGYNVAAMTYLRRPFEALIDQELQSYAKENGQDIEELRKKPMDQKVRTLKDRLPIFMAENSHIYSVISDGIHNRDDEELGPVFEACVDSIILILEQKAAQEEQRRRHQEVKSKLDRAAQQIRNNDAQDGGS